MVGGRDLVSCTGDVDEQAPSRISPRATLIVLISLVSRADGPGRGWGPRLGEEPGVGAPGGQEGMAWAGTTVPAHGSPHLRRAPAGGHLRPAAGHGQGDRGGGLRR